MIQVQKRPGDRILELGGGDNPVRSPDGQIVADVLVDVRQGQHTSFTQSLEEPLKLSSNEFDAVLSVFCFEHISYPKVPQLIAETFRVLKPGGRALVIVPNTEAQMRYILNKPEWDDDESCMIFGQQDYPENSHRTAWSPKTATKWFSQAGFANIRISPFGQLETDMVVDAQKPLDAKPDAVVAGHPELAGTLVTRQPGGAFTPNILGSNVEQVSKPPEEPYEPEKTFNRDYFNNYQSSGSFQWDYPAHEVIARKVLALNPESVFELGCGRGYVLKRIQDAGVSATGMDISQHAHLTRAAKSIIRADVTKTPWSCCPTDDPDYRYDLCFSYAFLEHVPEHLLSHVFAEMARTCKRGLHAITFQDDGADRTRRTIRPREWWQSRLPQGHQAVSVEEIRQGDLPPEVTEGDGRIKLAVGTYLTMSAYGWTNIDIHDLDQFAAANRYKYRKLDVRQGLPYGTGVVDAIHSAHMLEHLSYPDGLNFLRECRRVIRPDGVMRIIVPDAEKLMGDYLLADLPDRTGTYHDLSEFDQLNEGCANSPTAAGKLWALLHENHLACYDWEALSHALKEAGWEPHKTEFRKSVAGARGEQILKECPDVLADLSLFVEATPKLA